MSKESVIKRVRGVIVSSNESYTLRRLDNDYRTLMGEKIPYSKFGYRSLEEFLKSDPTLKVYNDSVNTFVHALTLPQSAHIVEMKLKEKAPKKKPMKYGRYSNKPAVPTYWKPKQLGRHDKSYSTSLRPAAVAHNQFVDYQKPKVPSKIVIPEKSSFAPNLPPRLQKQTSVGSRLQTEKHDTRSILKESNNYNYSQKGQAQGESSVSSRRKTITKMMSEVNLKDSAISAVSEINLNDIGNNILQKNPGPLIPTKNHEFKEQGDPKIDLQNLVNYHKLGVIEISTNKFITKKTKMYTCKLKIGNHVFNSYPEEFFRESDAELYCYEEAFKELSAKYGRRKSLLLANDRDILERIPKILEQHTKGLWEWQLQMDYSDKYHEQLPEDWLKIIDSSPCIHVQKVINNYTLRYCKPEDTLVPSNTVKFGEDGKLYAEIQFVLSASEIWCQQINTEENDMFVNMTIKIEEYYNKLKDQLQATTINQNGCYVAQYGEGWYRIRAVEVSEADVSCFFIDIGDETTLPREDIYKLEKEFADCPAQAFVCRLAGLEDLYEVVTESTILQEKLMYKQVVLELATDTEIENDVSIPVYMYDFDSGKSVNKELIPLLTIESASPSILTGEITEVHVSYTAANGDVYVQIHSGGFNRLLQSLQELELQISSDPPIHILEPVNEKNSKNKIYFCKYNVDGHWYRVSIIDWSPNGELAQIFYLDYGHTEVISINESVLYQLDKLSDVLGLYPPQAMKTRILLDEIPKDFIAVANKLMPKNEKVIIKIIKHCEEIPLAEFFRRNDDGSLFCINKSITMQSEITRKDSSKITKRSLSNADGSKNIAYKLECPQLPELEDSFQVRIPHAVNPYNFFIQPRESLHELNKMMEELQDQYKTIEYSPLTVDLIFPGSVYASKFEDGKWYRTIVIKVINNGSISVFYCDFGYYANLTVQQLIPLDIEFLQLPYQSLKAKLFGIKPQASNWTMEDCEQFKEMVERKCFYAILVKIERDELYDSDIVLDLVLIDTSSPEDIYVDKELINKGIAIEV